MRKIMLLLLSLVFMIPLISACNDKNKGENLYENSEALLHKDGAHLLMLDKNRDFRFFDASSGEPAISCNFTPGEPSDLSHCTYPCEKEGNTKCRIPYSYDGRELVVNKGGTETSRASVQIIDFKGSDCRMAFNSATGQLELMCSPPYPPFN